MGSVNTFAVIVAINMGQSPCEGIMAKYWTGSHGIKKRSICIVGLGSGFEEGIEKGWRKIKVCVREHSFKRGRKLERVGKKKKKITHRQDDVNQVDQRP